MDAPRDFAPLLEAYDLPGDFLEAVPYGSGHIHETWAASLLDQDRRIRFVVQRFNQAVFPHPKVVMENIARVLAHLRAKLENAGAPEPERHAPALVRTRGGGLYHRDEEGQVWRVFSMVEGASSLEIADSPARAFEAARAFGAFLRDLADLPAPRLNETIPRFHHTPTHLARLEEVVARDPKNRAAGARREIEAYLGAPKRRALARSLVDLQALGAIPERVIHNDTKLNNVLFDVATGTALCVVDLDTVMPGLALYDFGDMVRTSTSPRPEDETELAAIEARPEIFEALVRGYLTPLRGVLNQAEIENLVRAGQLITLECGSRFLADYLAGDVYFKVHHPEHNLERSRSQLALLRSLEEREAKFDAIVARVAGEISADTPPAGTPPPASSRPGLSASTIEMRGDVPEPTREDLSEERK